jgi:hypothetical protein
VKRRPTLKIAYGNAVVDTGFLREIYSSRKLAVKLKLKWVETGMTKKSLLKNRESSSSELRFYKQYKKS